MYKSRQKIIVISSLSALSLIGFSLGAYFIATSFDTKEIKDKTDASYRGATSALQNQFDINQKNISLSDWIFSNMPKRINFTDTSTASDKKYKIEFFDYTYNPAQESLGNMICSIDYTATSSNVSYTIWTDSNPPAPFKSLPLGGFSSSTGPNNEIIYNLTNYENTTPFQIMLNKNISPTPPTPDIDTYTSSLVDNSFSLEEKIFTGVSPTSTDSLFTYDIKDKTNTLIYKNQIQKITADQFQLVFTNPVASTTLNASISKDTTIATPKAFSYNVSYTGVLSGASVTPSTYESYSQFWNYLSDKSVKMPNVFGTIGMLDWVNKIG